MRLSLNLLNMNLTDLKRSLCSAGVSRFVINLFLEMSRFDPHKLRDFFKYYDPENPLHVDAVDLLQEEVESLDPDTMSDYAAWARLYRSKKNVNVGLKFTPFLFEKLTGRPARKFSVEFCHDCSYLFEATNFSDHLEPSRMLMANLIIETGGFRWLKELSDGLYLRGRSDLNHGPNEGEKWKGAGVIQLTGKYNYINFQQWLLKNEGIDDPRIVAEGADYVSVKYPFSSAIAWIQQNDLLNVCLNDGIDACCYRINGGWNHYAERLDAYDKCRKYMV